MYVIITIFLIGASIAHDHYVPTCWELPYYDLRPASMEPLRVRASEEQPSANILDDETSTT